MMKNKKFALFNLAMLFLAGGLGSSWAIGLSTTFGEVTVDNLQPGYTYNIREIANLPLRVKYSGGEPMDLVIEVKIPAENSVKKGYEPIPDISWVGVLKDRFTLAPGQEAVTDVIVSIPKDEKYYGKRYQAAIESSTLPPVRGGVSFAASVCSRLMINIAPHPLSIEETKKFTEKKIKGNLGFQLVPTRIFLKNIPVGKRVRVEKLMESRFKIVNPTDEPVKVKIFSQDLADKNIYLPPGYEKTPNPAILKIKKPKLKLKPSSIVPISMYLNFPDEEQFRGKKYLFIIEAASMGQYVSVSYWTHLYVETEGTEHTEGVAE